MGTQTEAGVRKVWIIDEATCIKYNIETTWVGQEHNILYRSGQRRAPSVALRRRLHLVLEFAAAIIGNLTIWDVLLKAWKGAGQEQRLSGATIPEPHQNIFKTIQVNT